MLGFLRGWLSFESRKLARSIGQQSPINCCAVPTRTLLNEDGVVDVSLTEMISSDLWIPTSVKRQRFNITEQPRIVAAYKVGAKSIESLPFSTSRVHDMGIPRTLLGIDRFCPSVDLSVQLPPVLRSPEGLFWNNALVRTSERLNLTIASRSSFLESVTCDPTSLYCHIVSVPLRESSRSRNARASPRSTRDLQLNVSEVEGINVNQKGHQTFPAYTQSIYHFVSRRAHGTRCIPFLVYTCQHPDCLGNTPTTRRSSPMCRESYIRIAFCHLSSLSAKLKIKG